MSHWKRRAIQISIVSIPIQICFPDRKQLVFSQIHKGSSGCREKRCKSAWWNSSVLSCRGSHVPSGLLGLQRDPSISYHTLGLYFLAELPLLNRLYNCMAEIKRCCLVNAFYSVCKRQSTSDRLIPQKRTVCQRSTFWQDPESAPAPQQGVSPIATTMSTAYEWAWPWETPHCPAQLSMQRSAFQQQRKTVPCCLPVKHHALGISSMRWLLYHSLKYTCQ